MIKSKQINKLTIQMEQQQIILLEQYIVTLEKENSAKNQERQTLYTSLSDLQAELEHCNRENADLKHFIQQLKIQNERVLSEQQRILSENQRLVLQEDQIDANMGNDHDDHEEKDKILNNFENLLREYEELSRSFEKLSEELENQKKQKYRVQQYYQQLEENLSHEQIKNNSLSQSLSIANKKAQRNILLEQQLSRKSQQVLQLDDRNKSLEEELASLKEQYDCLSNELEENCQQQQVPTELIENYEKIQAFAQEQFEENERLRGEIERVEEYARELEGKVSRGSERESRYHQQYGASRNQNETSRGSLDKDQISVSQVIRQNNRLIEKITELQREKNMLYSGRQHNLSRNRHENPTAATSPLKSVNKSHSHHHNNNNSSVSKLKMRIESLRQENENLMEALRLE